MKTTTPTEPQGLALAGAEDPYFTTWVRPNTLDALIRRGWVAYLGSGAQTDAKRLAGVREYRLTPEGEAAMARWEQERLPLGSRS